jgi:pyrrolidone-carboxylate peptidase
VELCGFNYSVETKCKARDDGMEILPSFTNIRKLSKLVQSNPDVEFSRDAGTYYCNEQLYCSLYELTKTDQYLPCVFVHLPPVAGEGEGLDKFTELVKEVIKFSMI